jgi:hypothetical protein
VWFGAHTALGFDWEMFIRTLDAFITSPSIEIRVNRPVGTGDNRQSIVLRFGAALLLSDPRGLVFVEIALEAKGSRKDSHETNEFL